MNLKNIVRSALVNGLVVLVALIFSLAVAEVMIRVVAPQQLIQIRPDLWKPADTVGWLHQPNVKASINTGEGEVSVVTDHEGLRVGSQGRVSGGWPVLILGDSFMEALQVEYEESFPGLLQKRLPTSAHVPVAIRNAGIGGWDPNQYLLQARAMMPREDYRLVIVSVYIGNDVLDKRVDYLPPRARTMRRNLRMPRALNQREIVEAMLRPLNDFLEVRSHLFVLARSRFETLRMRSGLHALAFPTEFTTTTDNAMRWSVTAEVCRDIRDEAQRHGAQTLFVFVPSPLQVDPSELQKFVQGFNVDSSKANLQQPNQRLKEEFSRRGLHVVDALPAFQEAHRTGKKLYGTVDRHLTAAGHEVLAQVVIPVAADILNPKRAAAIAASSLQ